MKTRIGFDIGCSSLKIAVAKGAVPVLHEIRLPEHMVENNEIAMPNAFSQFLRQQKKELRIPNGDGVLIVPPAHVVCRPVTVPRMNEQQLLMNLPYEFSDLIQGMPEQYLCDYALCEPTEAEEEANEMPMMAAVANKERMYGYVRMFAQAGIKLKVLIPQEMAWIRLAQEIARDGEEEKELCFVDLGHSSTRITVVKGDRVQAARQITVAMRELDQRIADRDQLDLFLAGTYKRENYKNVLTDPMCMEFYRQVAVEILKVINFYQFTFRDSALSGIFLVGGGANIEPLRQTIGEVVALPVLDPEELLPGAGEAAAGCPAGILAAAAAYEREGR